MDIWQKTKEELFLILKYCNLFFHYSRESVLDEFFLLLVMFFCLFVCFRRLTNLHRWMKPSENWKNSKGNYIGVFVLLLFCVCMVFSCFCFVFFLLLLHFRTSTKLPPSVSYLHNLLLNSSWFVMSPCEHKYVSFLKC